MEKIVFTNGCFDIIHPGHIDLLTRAKALGDRLIVGINSDSSVAAIKGSPRPFISQEDRKEILLGLRSVDEVRIFTESTPENLIREIKPDVLAKGGDWGIGEIVGGEFVRQNGGEVVSIPLKEGYSTTSIVERISKPAKAADLSRNVENAKDSIILDSLKAHISLFEVLSSDYSA